MTSGYREFFRQATGLPKPYPYQERLATEPWPDLLDVPTGLGKTAAIVLAWLYKQCIGCDVDTPRRLVYCLPMRVLVEQTEASVRNWLDRLALADRVGVHLLMGGADDILKATWAETPEKPAILIGTQDMLLSRALMRGYGMSRYQWPVHFAQLHSDALWVFDEVQLMGPALATSAQLDAFRQFWPLAAGSRSLWTSATLKADWLSTVDMKQHIVDFRRAALNDDDRSSPEVHQRENARKVLEIATVRLDKDNAKKKAAEYLNALADEVIKHHQAGTQTLVILNRVERAQELFERIAKRHGKGKTLLLHARFRPAERREIERCLKDMIQSSDRIVVATQAIEAGVDITSATLFTELAPWASLVQRFGRCNRYGECGEARLFCIDIDEGEEAAPYDAEALIRARAQVQAVINGGGSAGPGQLPRVEDERSASLVLRKRDFLELFNTDPDLSGFDIDISPYIRDTGTPQLQVFWRDFKEEPGDQTPATREELCPTSIGQIKDHLSKIGINAWAWDTVAGRWVKQDKQRVCPGQTLLLMASQGGYASELGFVPGGKAPVLSLPSVVTDGAEESYSRDDLSYIGRFVQLGEHLFDAEQAARELCAGLQMDAVSAQVVIDAAAAHDWGKAHPAFQHMLTHQRMPPAANVLWAKSDGSQGKPDYRMLPDGDNDKGQARPHFRHELASMLAWLEHNNANARRDLIAYLIAAHHGKVRMGLRALPREAQPKDGRLFARGVWAGDALPEVPLHDGTRLPATTLRLDLMRLGDGPMGLSWAARTHTLLDEYGPFRLAWLEALVRISDWRASKREAETPGTQGEPS